MRGKAQYHDLTRPTTNGSRQSMVAGWPHFKVLTNWQLIRQFAGSMRFYSFPLTERLVAGNGEWIPIDSPISPELSP